MCCCVSFMCCCFEYIYSMPILLGPVWYNIFSHLLNAVAYDVLWYISQSSLFIGRALGWGRGPLLLDACWDK